MGAENEANIALQSLAAQHIADAALKQEPAS
jgi:hypothetical protein